MQILFQLQCDLQKHNHKILNTVNLEYCFLSDDTLLYHRNAIDMSLLTDELNLKCYILYETKELLTEVYITIINILILLSVLSLLCLSLSLLLLLMF